MENDEEKYIEWHAKEKVFSISLGNQNNQYYEIKGEYASQMLLNTAWFEYEVAEKMAEIYADGQTVKITSVAPNLENPPF
jgi:hypothetical protein